MLTNLAKSLLKAKSIKTTLPKAKDLRGVIERLITAAKVDTIAKRRFVFSKLQDKAIVNSLFNDYARQYIDRPGGYTRVLKCGFRVGDSAPMALIQLV